MLFVPADWRGWIIDWFLGMEIKPIDYPVNIPLDRPFWLLFGIGLYEKTTRFSVWLIGWLIGRDIYIY